MKRVAATTEAQVVFFFFFFFFEMCLKLLCLLIVRGLFEQLSHQ